MIPTVSARLALAQSLYWDRLKPELAIACTATLLCQQWQAHDIAVKQLQRCLGQIATLERWQEGPNKSRSATAGTNLVSG